MGYYMRVFEIEVMGETFEVWQELNLHTNVGFSEHSESAEAGRAGIENTRNFGLSRVRKAQRNGWPSEFWLWRRGEANPGEEASIDVPGPDLPPPNIQLRRTQDGSLKLGLRPRESTAPPSQDSKVACLEMDGLVFLQSEVAGVQLSNLQDSIDTVVRLEIVEFERGAVKVVGYCMLGVPELGDYLSRIQGWLLERFAPIQPPETSSTEGHRSRRDVAKEAG